MYANPNGTRIKSEKIELNLNGPDRPNVVHTARTRTFPNADPWLALRAALDPARAHCSMTRNPAACVVPPLRAGRWPVDRPVPPLSTKSVNTDSRGESDTSCCMCSTSLHRLDRMLLPMTSPFARE